MATAAISMETSVRSIQVLGDEMAATSGRLSDSVQDGRQALVVLARVVEQLQAVLADTQTLVAPPAPPAPPGSQDALVSCTRR